MQIYNSLSRNKDEFVAFKDTLVTIYVCGITPYDTTHLGHAFTYISFDVLMRYLKYLGYTVSYTQNVTDINDRDNDILKKAKEQNTTWEDLSEIWTKRFLDDMNTLNWIMPDKYLKASENIPSMINIIQKLVDNGIGYVVNGSVYLDISKISNFGKLSGLSTKQMMSKAKDFEEDLTNPDKKNPLDITLWRSASDNQPPHIPSFNSPFGLGRPGWHIECSAMATDSLGDQIDIHGGGTDLIYPHHESEIAQSEGATKQVPFAKYWMHTGTLHYQGAKMSKSLGNLVMVSKLLKRYCPNAIRWLLLSHRWHSDWEFTYAELDLAHAQISSIQDIIKNTASSHTKQQKIDREYLTKFAGALDDNLDTPKAQEIILDLTKEIKNNNKSELVPTLQMFAELLGYKF